MAHIDSSIINEIRDKTDIVDVISKYVSLTKKGKNYFGVCPFHDDHSPSMSVSPDKQIYTCFSCGTSGNVFTFVADYEHISFIEAVKLLGDKLGYNLNNSISKKNQNIDYDIYDIALKFYQNTINTVSGKKALDYLLKRDIDIETIKKFEIGLSPMKSSLTDILIQKKYNLDKLINLGISNNNSNDLFINRIMFPIHDINGRVVAFSGRIYNYKDSSKYINTKETDIFKKGSILYNYHRAKEMLRKNSKILIMEGFMDVIRCSMVGINNCVATMGTALTKEHVSLIRKLSDNVVLCFDGDLAGEEATISAANMLEKNGIIPRIIRLEDNLDPDEYIKQNGVKKFEYKIETAENLLDFRMKMLKQNKNLSDIRDISIYVDDSIKEVSKLSDEIMVELTLKKMANEFSIEYDTLYHKYIKFKESNKKIKNIVIRDKKKVNRYQIAERNLLFHMINDSNVISIVEHQVPYMPDNLFRFLANEIIYYNNKIGIINPSDFFSYLAEKDNEELMNTYKEVMTNEIISINKEEEISDYIKIINGYVIDKKIENINSDVKKEIDPMIKAALVDEKINIRKEVTK